MGKVLPFRRRSKREHGGGSICVDCLALAKGTEPEHMSTEELADHLDRVDNHPNADYKMTLGHVHDDVSVGCWHAGEACKDDCECERRELACFTCDMCDSELAGEWFDVTFWFDTEEGN